MKKIYQLTALLILCLFGACSEDALDGLSGKYDMERRVYTEVIEQTTDKVGKGVKRLTILFEDEAGSEWNLIVYSPDWVLQGGIYQLGESLEATVPGTFLASVSSAITNDNETHAYIANGTLEVTLLGDTYYIDGLFQTTDGKRYSCDYKGSISFVIGEDDPEASGYTAILSKQPVYLTDAAGQVTGVVPGMTKYSFAVSAPDGKSAAQFDIINSENLALTALGGSYTVTGTSEPGSMDAGNALPAEWGGASWGSYFINKSVKQFIAGGTLVISVATGMEGETLLTFAGQNLNTTLGMDATGTPTPGTATELDIRFVTVSQSGVE